MALEGRRKIYTVYGNSGVAFQISQMGVSLKFKNISNTKNSQPPTSVLRYFPQRKRNLPLMQNGGRFLL